ncbi:MAG: hypothetical protein ACP5RP_00705 [Candidatus Micrarchaeia archaeon]
MKKFFIMLFLLLSIESMLEISKAATITLTGGCPSSIITNSTNYFEFNLSAKGNSSASNLVITPMLDGMPVSSPIRLKNLSSGESVISKIYLNKLPENGTHVYVLELSYDQAGSNFVTYFPCKEYINKEYGQMLEITNFTYAKRFKSLNLTLYNLFNYPMNASVLIYAPPGIKIDNPVISMSIPPLSQNSVQIHMSVPASATGVFSYPITAIASYSKDRVFYSAYFTAYVNNSNMARNGFLSSLPLPMQIFYGILAVIIIITILIVYAKIKKAKHEVKKGE